MQQLLRQRAWGIAKVRRKISFDASELKALGKAAEVRLGAAVGRKGSWEAIGKMRKRHHHHPGTAETTKYHKTSPSCPNPPIHNVPKYSLHYMHEVGEGRKENGNNSVLRRPRESRLGKPNRENILMKTWEAVHRSMLRGRSIDIHHNTGLLGHALETTTVGRQIVV